MDEAPADPTPDVDRLMPLVYDELKRLAGRLLRSERASPSLAATSIVHEAYLRLAEQHRALWNDRAHFFRVAAQMMRRVLVDHYRTRHAKKRGGGGVAVTLLENAQVEEAAITVDLIDLDEALTALGRQDPKQAEIVEMRFFAGLTVDETAEALGISPATVKREWALAKAWLLVAIEGSTGT